MRSRNERNARGQFRKGNPGGPGRKPGPKKLATEELLQIINDANYGAVDAMLMNAQAPIPDGLPPQVEQMLQIKRRMAEAAQRILLKRLAAELGE